MINANFRKLVLGRAVGNAGDSIYMIAMNWFILQLTNSALWIGIMNVAIVLPGVLLFLFGDSIDRHSKRRLLVAVEFSQLVIVVMLIGLVALHIKLPGIYVGLVFVAALFGSLAYPIQDTLVPLLVEPEQLVQAQADMSIAYKGTDYVFNALSGFLISLCSVLGVLIMDAATFVVTVATFRRIKLAEPRQQHTREKSLYLNQILVGFKIISTDPLLRLLTFASVVMNFFFGGLNTYVVLFGRHFGGSIYYGILESMSAVGILLGMTVVYRQLKKLTVRQSYLIGNFGRALFMILTVVSYNQFWLFAIIYLLSFVFQGLTQVFETPMIQATVGSDQLGKVMTCFYTLVSVTLPLGSLAFSFLADRFDLRLFLLLFALFYAGIFLLFLASHAFKKVDELQLS
ncbi:MFS transporter [Lactiplantibacillus plantarum]|uniref:MFS transporter n=1 Tax=Lactiplantibacillus plantarum TaxID=1590 RepID=UPI003D36B531